MRSSYNPGGSPGFFNCFLGFSVFRPIFIAGRLIVRDDATTTVRNIATHELLFRSGIPGWGDALCPRLPQRAERCGCAPAGAW